MPLLGGWLSLAANALPPVCFLSGKTGLLARRDLPRHAESGSAAGGIVAAHGASDGCRASAHAVPVRTDLVLEPGGATAIGGRVVIDLASVGRHQG